MHDYAELWLNWTDEFYSTSRDARPPLVFFFGRFLQYYRGEVARVVTEDNGRLGSVHVTKLVNEKEAGNIVTVRGFDLDGVCVPIKICRERNSGDLYAVFRALEPVDIYSTERDPPFLLKCASDLAGVLGALHAHGYVHGDVKPDNLLLDGSQVLLTDWGTLARVGSLVKFGGTHLFAANEALANDGAAGTHQTDPSVDWCSLVYTMAWLSGATWKEQEDRPSIEELVKKYPACMRVDQLRQEHVAETRGKRERSPSAGADAKKRPNSAPPSPPRRSARFAARVDSIEVA